MAATRWRQRTFPIYQAVMPASQPMTSGTLGTTTNINHLDYGEAGPTTNNVGYIAWRVPQAFTTGDSTKFRCRFSYTLGTSGDDVDGGANDDVVFKVVISAYAAGASISSGSHGVASREITEEMQDLTADRINVTADLTFTSGVEDWLPGELLLFKIERDATDTGDDWPNVVRYVNMVCQWEESEDNNTQYVSGTAAAEGKYWEEEWLPAISFVGDTTASKAPPFGTRDDNAYARYHFHQYSATADQFLYAPFVVPEDFDNEAGSFSVKDYWESDYDPSDTVLLLHMDDSDFSDSSATGLANPTKNGTPDLDTSTTDPFGGTAGVVNFDGTESLQYADNSAFDISSGEFTVDFWARWTSQTSTDGLLHNHNSSPNGGWAIIYNGTKLLFNYSSAGTITQYSWTPSLSTWYHIAVTFDGTTDRMFIDGSLVHSVTRGTAPVYEAGGLAIGERYGTSDPFDGKIDEVRIVKGPAVWTSNFTPPTSPYGAEVVWQTALLGIAEGEPDDAAFVAGDTEAHTGATADSGADRGLNITTHTMSGTVSLTKNDLCQMRVGRLAASDADDDISLPVRHIGRSIQYLRDTSLGGAW